MKRDTLRRRRKTANAITARRRRRLGKEREFLSFDAVDSITPPANGAHSGRRTATVFSSLQRPHRFPSPYRYAAVYFRSSAEAIGGELKSGDEQRTTNDGR